MAADPRKAENGSLTVGGEGPTVTIGGAKIEGSPPGKGMGMSEEVWDRLYRHVARIHRPARWHENLMWTAVGIFAAAALGAATYWDFKPEGGPAGGQFWAFLAVAVVAAVVAGLAGGFHLGAVDQLVRDKEDVLEEMRDISMPISVRQKPAQGQGPSKG